MKRNFTNRERAAIYIAADGKSDESGEPLGESFHADHAIPFAAGGETDVANGRALTPKENLMKSCRHVELRGWQTSFVEKWEQTTGDFLLCAIPGAGKTIAALYVARQFLDRYPSGRICIVVPSVNLRDQWQNEAWQAFGVSLQSKEFHGSLKADNHGAVFTYQTAASSPLVFRAIVSRQPTLVIFDEIHHAGEDPAAIKRLIKDDPVTLRLFEEAITPPVGKHRDDSSNATIIEKDRGKAYTLRRLAKDRPDLLEKVEAGELSANKAAIEAGFRRIKTPMEQMALLWGKLSESERAKFLKEIGVG